jgi:hypothetical protein
MSVSEVTCVDCLKTVIDYNSADKCAIDSDKIIYNGHV